MATLTVHDLTKLPGKTAEELEAWRMELWKLADAARKNGDIRQYDAFNAIEGLVAKELRERENLAIKNRNTKGL